MLFDRIFNKDNVFRHSVFPVSFKGKMFAPEKLLKFFDEPDGSLLTSVAWERFLPTHADIHAYGCRLAAGRNQQKRDDGTYKERNRHIYCGAYQLTCSAVRALAGPRKQIDEILSADVVHHIENGEIAHADLKVVL